MENWQNYTTINSEIRSEKPSIKGTRITVSDVLSYLVSGMSVAELIKSFPELNTSQILAALSFGAHRDSITKISVA